MCRLYTAVMTRRRSTARLLACALLTLLSVSRDSAAPIVAGTWRLDKTRSELSRGLREYQATLEQSLKVDVAGNVVTVVTTTVGIPVLGVLGLGVPPENWCFCPPPPPGSAVARVLDRELVTTQRLDVDGQLRTFEWGDVIGQTASRTVNWLADSSVFEVIEDFGPGSTTHRWTTSTDGEVLMVESIQQGIQQGTLRETNRLVRVFVRQH